MVKSSVSATKSGSLERGLAIIELLASTPVPVTLSEIAKRTELPNSVTHRLLMKLIELGCVVREPNGRRYLASPSALSPLNFQHPIVVLRESCRTAITNLRNKTGETAAFVLFIGYERLVLEYALGNRKLAPNYQTWLKSPVHGSASGKILLTAVDDSYFEDVLGPEPYRAHTAKTITSEGALQREVAQVRSKGCSISIDEAYDGVSAFGHTVKHDNKTIGAITLTVETDSLDSGRQKFLNDELERTLNELKRYPGALKEIYDWLY